MLGICQVNMMGGNWECVAVCLGVTVMKGMESKLCKDEMRT